jgi:hypothetical protein
MNIVSQSNGSPGVNGQKSTLHSTSSSQASHQKIIKTMEVKEHRHVSSSSENRSYKLQ